MLLLARYQLQTSTQHYLKEFEWLSLWFEMCFFSFIIYRLHCLKDLVHYAYIKAKGFTLRNTKKCTWKIYLYKVIFTLGLYFPLCLY